LLNQKKARLNRVQAGFLLLGVDLPHGQSGVAEQQPGVAHIRVSRLRFGLPRRVTQTQMAGAVAPANPRLSALSVFCRIKDAKT
jgi:hypothetical protein